MIRKISTTVILIISAFSLLVSCINKKAENLQDILAKKESQAFEMLAGKNGFESSKLNLLITHEYEKALAVIDKEEAEFNRIIEDIEKADIEGVTNGKDVKLAAISYYTALKDLFIFSRKEIGQEQLLHSGKKDKEIHAAQDRMIELGREKQKLFQKVFTADEKLFSIQKQFESENQLK